MTSSGDTSDFEAVPRRRASDHVIPKTDLSDPSIHTAKVLRRTLRVLIGLTCVLYVIIGALSVSTFILASKNTRALCAVRQAAQDRVEQYEDFLSDNPKGIQGISVADIRRTIDTSREAVRSLSDVNCPPIP